MMWVVQTMELKWLNLPIEVKKENQQQEEEPNQVPIEEWLILKDQDQVLWDNKLHMAKVQQPNNNPKDQLMVLTSKEVAMELIAD